MGGIFRNCLHERHEFLHDNPYAIHCERYSASRALAVASASSPAVRGSNHPQLGGVGTQLFGTEKHVIRVQRPHGVNRERVSCLSTAL